MRGHSQALANDQQVCPRFGFENLYAPAALRSLRVLWEIRQFVAHFATQRNSGVLTILISGFSFFQYDMVTHP